MHEPLILVTTDFSEQSARAYGPAAEIARRLDGRILLVHVVEVAAVPPHGAPLAPVQMPPDTSADVDAAKKRIQAEATKFTGVPVETLVEAHGSAVQAIVHVAKERNADMIALSTHGRTGLRRLVLGSVAEQIVRRSSVPVLCFPAA